MEGNLQNFQRITLENLRKMLVSWSLQDLAVFSALHYVY